VQKADGSFGESANSYENPSLKGQGPSTASQTAWAAMILQEIYGANDPDLQRAVEWLARTQLTPADAADPLKNPDGDGKVCAGAGAQLSGLRSPGMQAVGPGWLNRTEFRRGFSCPT